MMPEPVIDPFFLYLRSFASDKPTSESWELTGPDGKTGSYVTGSPKVLLESLLEAAGPFIEFGGKEHQSLGQVASDEEHWWLKATRLIIHATAVFVSPGLTPSVEQEAEWILRQPMIKRRTFLIMEPTHQTMLSAAQQQDRNAAADRSARWGRVTEFYRRHGVILPPYDPGGAVISLHYPPNRLRFVGMSRHQLYDLLQSMYVDLGKIGSYDIKQVDPCPCESGKQFRLCHYKRATVHFE